MYTHTHTHTHTHILKFSFNLTENISLSTEIKKFSLQPTRCFSHNVKVPFFYGLTAHNGPRPPHYRGFTMTLRHTTLGSTPLDELSARRTDLYLTTRNTHKKADIQAPGTIRTRNRCKWGTADLRLIKSGHWDRQVKLYGQYFSIFAKKKGSVCSFDQLYKPGGRVPVTHWIRAWWVPETVYVQWRTDKSTSPSGIKSKHSGIAARYEVAWYILMRYQPIRRSCLTIKVH